MYKKVLVPLDGSELAECSLNHIKNLAKDGSIGEVVLLNAVVLELPLREINTDEDSSDKGFDYRAFKEDHFRRSRQYLDGVQAKLSSAGIKVKTESLETGRPAHLIIDYVAKNDVDMIVIATHGHSGMRNMLLGSVAFRVLHEANVPVLLIRPKACHIS
jgi:nucleotide-binding universal stress UspA family protein